MWKWPDVAVNRQSPKSSPEENGGTFKVGADVVGFELKNICPTGNAEGPRWPQWRQFQWRGRSRNQMQREMGKAWALLPRHSSAKERASSAEVFVGVCFALPCSLG